MGLCILLCLFFTATDRPRPSHIIALLRGFFLVVPVTLVLAHRFGRTGVWLAVPAAEALGVTVAVGPLYARLTHTYPDLTVELLLYQAAIAEGTPRLLEHAALRWVAVDELAQYTFCPADAPILERLRTEGLPPEFSPAP